MCNIPPSHPGIDNCQNKSLANTLKYNIGVFTKNKVATLDLPEVMEKNELHKKIMKDTTKGEPLMVKTYKAVLKHLKKKNKNMFRHITKAGQYFQDAMYIYMADFMDNELVPDTYTYTSTCMTTQNYSGYGKVKAINLT